MSFTILLLYLITTFIRPQEWVPAFFDKPIIDILVVLALLTLFVERLGRHDAGFAKVPQNFLIFGLYFSIVMSHLAHTYFGGLTMAVQSFLVIFILFFLLLNGVNTELKFKTAIWVIVFLIFLLVHQGVYQVEHGYGWAGQSIIVDPHRDLVRINWVGIFSDPNDLALTFVMACGLLLPFAFGKSGFAPKMTSLFFMGFLLYGIYLTNSRGGLLALMAAIFFYFVRKTKKFLFGGIVGGALAFVTLIFGPSRAGLITVQEESAHNRVELWYQGIVMMKSNPLFGVGFNMYTDQLAQTAHNSYILAGAELGLLGLFFWMALIYSSFKGLSIIQANDEKSVNYALGLQASLVGFCAAAFFLSRTYIILPYILFALSGSLMYIVGKKKPELDFSFGKKDAKRTLALSIGVILLSYGVVKFGL